MNWTYFYLSLFNNKTVSVYQYVCGTATNTRNHYFKCTRLFVGQVIICFILELNKKIQNSYQSKKLNNLKKKITQTKSIQSNTQEYYNILSECVSSVQLILIIIACFMAWMKLWLYKIKCVQFFFYILDRNRSM